MKKDLTLCRNKKLGYQIYLIKKLKYKIIK